MATLEDMIQEVLVSIEGYTGDQDTYGLLYESVDDPTATVIQVKDPGYLDTSGFTAGIVEIGSELVNVLNLRTEVIDEAGTRVIFLDPVIRGFRGTTATTHAQNTLVRNNPRFPRTVVQRALNDTILALHPRVSAIKTWQFTALGARVRYDVPADVKNILQVQYLPPGPGKQWVPIRRFNFDYTGGSESATGRALDVWGAMPGRPVQIVYQAAPSPMVNSDDNFTETSGLEEWARDLIIYGAAYRITAFLDASKVSGSTYEQSQVNGRSVYGGGFSASGTSLSKYFYGLYQARLTEVESRLQDLYPVSVHYIR